MIELRRPQQDAEKCPWRRPLGGGAGFAKGGTAATKRDQRGGKAKGRVPGIVQHPVRPITFRSLWRSKMRKLGFLLVILTLPASTVAQNLSGLFPDITQQQNYVLKRVSSYDRTGANEDEEDGSRRDTDSV